MLITLAKQNKLNVENNNFAKIPHSRKAGSFHFTWELAGIQKKLKFEIYICVCMCADGSIK